MTTDSKNRVPHLRDGFIVEEVGIAQRATALPHITRNHPVTKVRTSAVAPAFLSVISEGNLRFVFRAPRIRQAIAFLAMLFLTTELPAQKPAHISGQATYALTKEFLAAAPKRFNGSPGHLAAENFIKSHFAPEAAKGNLETDQFTASTPAGLQTMRNYIVRFPGKALRPDQKDGIIVLASHYETNYPLKDTAFVGANDGACTSALLIEIGQYLRTHPPDGYSVWLLFDDGEEAVKSWTDADSLYGTRHIAAKWSQDGTIAKIKAVLIADMIGDKNLNILDETTSTQWLRDALHQAAVNTHHQASVGQTSGAELDDHLPFLKRGVPALDIIDTDYGPHTAALPDGYHHTDGDTLDKISPQSLQTAGDLFLELIRLINQH